MATGNSRRKKAWPLVMGLVVAAAVLFFLVRGCALFPWNRATAALRVRVTVTRDFGESVLRDLWTDAEEGASAMRVLQEVARVETAYGGGFVKGIDGLRSLYEDPKGSRKVDWFFYVNGQMADVGADAYQVREGDWVLFDYHCWEYSLFTTLLAGCFPEPFLHGYGGPPPRSTVVLYPPGRIPEAEMVARILEEAGADAPTLRELDEDWVPGEGEYAVVVGLWKELERNHYLRGSQSEAARIGLYARFRDDTLEILDQRGERSRVYREGAGLVAGTGPRLGDGRSAFLVAALDEQGMREVLEQLGDGLAGGKPVPSWAVLAGGGGFGVPGEVE